MKGGVGNELPELLLNVTTNNVFHLQMARCEDR